MSSQPFQAKLTSCTDPVQDRKSTRLNSSHSQISYAVFCLKKKNETAGKTGHNPLGDYVRILAKHHQAVHKRIVRIQHADKNAPDPRMPADVSDHTQSQAS